MQQAKAKWPIETPKRASLAYALVCAFVVSLLFPSYALAYVDPSVVTYAVQAIAGVAVAISAVLGVAFRKVRNKIQDLLGIDPAANKEKDPAYVAFEGGESGAITMDSREAYAFAAGGSTDGQDLTAGKTTAKRRNDEVNFSWQTSFLIALLVSLMSIGTLLIVAPIEIVAGSASDFFFKPEYIAEAIIPLSLQIIVLVALIISVFPRKPFLYIVSVLFAIGLGFYLQAMLMNTGLPIADGRPVDWSKYSDLTIVSSIVWIALIVGCLVLVKVRPRLASATIVLAAIALVVVQGAGVAAIVSGSDIVDTKSQSKDVICNEGGLFEISPDSNIVIFVLDTFDTRFLFQTLEAYPDALKDFTGFTWFQNTVGSTIPTRYAIPYLLTGVYPEKGKTWADWQKTRYQTSHYLPDIAAAGYSIDLYTDEAYFEVTNNKDSVDELLDLISNMNRDGYLNELDVKGAYDALVGCALYRDLPWVFKPDYRFNTSDVSAAMLAEIDEKSPEATTYVHDDVAYYQKLKSNGLTLVSGQQKLASGDAARGERDSQAIGAFKFIHLMGSHYPYTMSLDGKRVKQSTLEDQSAASLKMVAYYLNQMKKLGVYDEATIIVTADHGDYHETLDDLDETSTPIILAKPRQSHEAAAKSVKVSSAPVTHGDIMPTVVSAVGGNVSTYAGKSLFAYNGSEDPNRPRYYLTNLQSPVDHKDKLAVEWCITGNSLDISNWSTTGVAFDIHAEDPKRKQAMKENAKNEPAKSEKSADKASSANDKDTAGAGKDAKGLEKDSATSATGKDSKKAPTTPSTQKAA